jgi:hypothetical protein
LKSEDKPTRQDPFPNIYSHDQHLDSDRGRKKNDFRPARHKIHPRAQPPRKRCDPNREHGRPFSAAAAVVVVVHGPFGGLEINLAGLHNERAPATLSHSLAGSVVVERDKKVTPNAQRASAARCHSIQSASERRGSERVERLWRRCMVGSAVGEHQSSGGSGDASWL